MSARADSDVRIARSSDVKIVARLLHDFNTEFAEPAPSPDRLAERIDRLLAEGQTAVFLAGPGPDGLAVLRFRPSIWTDGLECYLAELYVAPHRRRRGYGWALMQAAIDHARCRGADYMDLNTSETDVAARALYERLGFSNTEGKVGRPVNYYYELAL
jgi:ribosomal protein S18 acetylase RimI-like enzyme